MTKVIIAQCTSNRQIFDIQIYYNLDLSPESNILKDTLSLYIECEEFKRIDNFVEIKEMIVNNCSILFRDCGLLIFSDNDDQIELGKGTCYIEPIYRYLDNANIMYYH